MGPKRKLSMKDVLLWSKGEPPKPGPRRIGIHTSTAGGVESAAERAYRALLLNVRRQHPAPASDDREEEPVAASEVMYDLPSRTDVVKCMVDRDVVMRQVAPTLVTEDEGRRSA